MKTHFYCLDCNVVVPISFEAAAEVARHVGHRCRYTVVKPTTEGGR
jgi:Fe2+ or Zn2+ uptake regulation protein